MPTRISIIAGEASGDLMGGRLAQCLRSIEPDVVLAGIGGERMRDAGVRLWDDPTRLSAVGIVEVLLKLRSFKKLFDATLKAIVDMRPDVVVLIDYPGFNLRLGDRLKALGIPCVYYIPPTAWAWGAKRAERVAGFAQKVLSVFPFEVDVYAGAGANVEFVGHPLVDSLEPFSVSERLQFVPGAFKVLGLFPGSRDQEIDKLLPVMLESCKIIQKVCRDVLFELSRADCRRTARAEVCVGFRSRCEAAHRQLSAAHEQVLCRRSGFRHRHSRGSPGGHAYGNCVQGFSPDDGCRPQAVDDLIYWAPQHRARPPRSARTGAGGLHSEPHRR